MSELKKTEARGVAAPKASGIGPQHRDRSGNDSTPRSLRTSAHDESPEHRNDRRRFLVWALMAGMVPPQRVTERVVAELAEEAP